MRLFPQVLLMRGTADVGAVHGDVLFSSDRTSKESACCFTAAAPRGAPNVDRQATYTPSSVT